MYKHWTREDIKASSERLHNLYVKAPIDYRFFCGHDIQSEDDMDALDYYIIGVWLIQHRRYTDWSDRKSFDLAEVLEFMRIYGNSNSTIHETHQILSKEKGSAFKDIKWELYPCASHIIYAHTSPYNVLSFFVFVFFYENYFMKMLS